MMKPDFALDFRDGQIALLHRQEAGWSTIGQVAMDDPDLDAAMAYLRATALGLSPRGIATKLILPNDAILYTNLPDLPQAPGPRAAQIRAGLVGRTPYAVDDLVWDWTDRGASADVAVIAKETLAEAESFAQDHRFNPVSFAAIPAPGAFDGEVWFGVTKLSQSLIAPGEVVERDEVFAFAAETPPISDAPAAAQDFEMGALAETVTEMAPPPAAPEPAPDGRDGVADSGNAADQQDLPLFTQANAPDATTTAPTPPEKVPSRPDPVMAAPAAGEATSPPPASFAAAMADLDTPIFDTPGPDAPEASGQEAPMAVDVPLLDDTETEQAGAASPAEHREKSPQGPAEQPLAAFSAQRAATKANAGMPAPRRESDDADWKSPALAPLPDSRPAAIAARAAPAVGAAIPPRGSATTTSAQLGLIPAKVVPIPAKDGPRKTQNLKSMPRPKQKGGNTTLLWVLVAALLVALTAAAAISQYVLESYNRLFFPETVIVQVADDLPADGPAHSALAQTILPFGDRGGRFLMTLPPPTAQPATAGAAPVAGDGGGGTVAPEPAALAAVEDAPTSQATAEMVAVAGRIAPGGGAMAVKGHYPLPAAPVSAPVSIARVSPALPAPAPARGTLADTGALASQVAADTSGSTPIARGALADDAPKVGADDDSAAALVALTSDDLPMAFSNVAEPWLATVRPAPRAAIIGPDGGAAAAQAAQAQPFADPALANARPNARPASITAADSAPAVFADPNLADARPLIRPAGISDAGRAARLASAPASLVASAQISAAEASLNPTPVLAPQTPSLDLGPMSLTVSRIPPARPQFLKAAFDAARDADIVALAAAAALEAPTETAPPEAPPPPPATPDEEDELSGGAASRTMVAKQSTQRNAINLNQLNLVGIFGTKTNRYALIRQPMGAIRKVQVGDRLNGGKVAAITESEVLYAKGGQMLALQMPRG